MIRPLLAYARGAGLEARWLVIQGQPELLPDHQARAQRHPRRPRRRQRPGHGRTRGLRAHPAHQRRGAAQPREEGRHGDPATIPRPRASRRCSARPACTWCGVRTSAPTAPTPRPSAAGTSCSPTCSTRGPSVFSRAAYVPAMFKGMRTAIMPALDRSLLRQEPGAAGREGPRASSAPRAWWARREPARTAATRDDGTLGEVRLQPKSFGSAGRPRSTPRSSFRSRAGTLLKDPIGVMRGLRASSARRARRHTRSSCSRARASARWPTTRKASACSATS